MATAAVLARGTRFQVETSPGSGTYTTIAECRSITWPNPQSAEVDVTNHDSAGRSKEFLIGDQDFGEASAELNYLQTNAQHVQAIVDRDATVPTQRSYQILVPSPGTLRTRFNAYVSGFDRQAQIGQQLTGTLRLRVTGLPTEVA